MRIPIRSKLVVVVLVCVAGLLSASFCMGCERRHRLGGLTRSPTPRTCIPVAAARSRSISSIPARSRAKALSR